MKNIIASGCSFTENGIGGVPPTDNLPGGAGLDTVSDLNNLTPKSWASFFVETVKPNSFVNTASGSHGNHLVSTTIIELLSRYNYKNSDTLILFNISSFFRHDFLCKHSHPDVSFRTPWTEELLDFNFLNTRSKTHKMLSDTVDIKQTVLLSKNFVKTLFEFLDNNNFKFYFLWMEDYNEIFYSDRFLKKFLDLRIDCGNHNNMLDFCISKNLTVSSKDHHPSNEGHKHIADFVLSRL